MSNQLPVKLTSRTSVDSGEEYWEGTVTLEGVKTTKLVRKSDGSSRFSTRSSIVGAARRFADRYGYSDIDLGEQTTTVKKAAKKSVSLSTTPTT